jgi:tRNA (adenine37-N6)-methyltransferase
MRPIGVVRSAYHVAEKTPAQPIYAQGCRGTIEIFEDYGEGLSDVEGFSHIYVLFHLDKARPMLKVKPILDVVERGVFATRSPCRPNRIGLSVVELIERKGNVLLVDGLDVLDGSPVLDIKPYTDKFDQHRTSRNGWLDGVDERTARLRGRRELDPAS